MAAGPRQSSAEEESAARPWRAVALTALTVLLLLGCLLAIEPLRNAFGDAIRGDTSGLRADLRDLGAGGVAILFLLVAIHTFVWYPAEIVDAAAGFVFGFWPAFGMLTIGWTAQALAAYTIGRRAARPLLYRFVGQGRFDRIERAVDAGGVTLLLAARLVPIVPFSLFSYVAGAARVPIWRFTWTTALGYIPITALSIYLGSRLEHLSPTDPLIWASALIVVGLLLLTRRLRPLLQGED